jgi:hypothetical protein
VAEVLTVAGVMITVAAAVVVAMVVGVAGVVHVAVMGRRVPRVDYLLGRGFLLSLLLVQRHLAHLGFLGCLLLAPLRHGRGLDLDGEFFWKLGFAAGEGRGHFCVAGRLLCGGHNGRFLDG